MSTATLQKELKELKQRQGRLERMVYEALRRQSIEELRPEYVRKLRRIARDMRAGRGVSAVRTRGELRTFFHGL